MFLPSLKRACHGEENARHQLDTVIGNWNLLEHQPPINVCPTWVAFKVTARSSSDIVINIPYDSCKYLGNLYKTEIVRLRQSCNTILRVPLSLLSNFKHHINFRCRVDYTSRFVISYLEIRLLSARNILFHSAFHSVPPFISLCFV